MRHGLLPRRISGLIQSRAGRNPQQPRYRGKAHPQKWGASQFGFKGITEQIYRRSISNVNELPGDTGGGSSVSPMAGRVVALPGILGDDRLITPVSRWTGPLRWADSTRADLAGKDRQSVGLVL
jgi:hypothetical protein